MRQTFRRHPGGDVAHQTTDCDGQLKKGVMLRITNIAFGFARFTPGRAGNNLLSTESQPKYGVRAIKLDSPLRHITRPLRRVGSHLFERSKVKNRKGQTCYRL